MADSFPCPQCGKTYSRENRLVGKAVVCECGHRFLVPPAEQAAQPPPSFPSLPRSLSPRASRQTPAPGASVPKGTRPGQPAPRPPQRRPNQTPGRSPGQTRWADPVEPEQRANDDTVEAEPMLVAEVVLTPAVPPAEDDFDDDAEEVVLVPVGAKPAPPARRPANLRTPARRPAVPPSTGGRSPARLALMVGLPLVALLMIVAAAGVWYFGNRGDIVAEAETAQPSAEPPASGEPVTLFGARSVKRGEANEFRVEFRLDGLKPDAKAQYRWVIAGAEGWLEFPVPVSALVPRSRLSGTAPADAGRMTGPLRCYLEELAAGALVHDRISNEVPIGDAG